MKEQPHTRRIPLRRQTYTTMKNIISYTAILAFALTAPLTADIINPAPAANAGAVRGNCDLLASNTVRASFVGLRDMPIQTVDQDTPSTVQVAVFEVIDSLGYRKYVRYGDGQLTAGTRFTIAMNKELPGQPASVVDTIFEMQPGEEAVLKIDHLYLLGGQEGTPIRACSRMVRRNAQPEAAPAPADGSASPAPAMPNSVCPLGGAPQAQIVAQRTRTVMQPDANGVMQCIQINEYVDATGRTTIRMYINGVEVDPQTRQPLNQQPAPAGNSEDDTIIDRGPAAPAAPQQQGTPTAPAPRPADGQNISEADSF